MRDPYDVLGVAKTPRPRTSSRPSASSPRSITRTRIRMIPRRRTGLRQINQAYEISATTRSAAHSTAARSTPRASRASRALKRAGAGARRRSVRRLPPQAAPAPGGARFEFAPAAGRRRSVRRGGERCFQPAFGEQRAPAREAARGRAQPASRRPNRDAGRRVEEARPPPRSRRFSPTAASSR
jgi:hypothetical protein